MPSSGIDKNRIVCGARGYVARHRDMVMRHRRNLRRKGRVVAGAPGARRVLAGAGRPPQPDQPSGRAPSRTSRRRCAAPSGQGPCPAGCGLRTAQHLQGGWPPYHGKQVVQQPRGAPLDGHLAILRRLLRRDLVGLALGLVAAQPVLALAARRTQLRSRTEAGGGVVICALSFSTCRLARSIPCCNFDAGCRRHLVALPGRSCSAPL
jgi:hypothetical protein